MLAQFLQFLFSGVTVGATYALAALGFTLIYNASNVINFAQGEFIMLGGMLAVLFTQAGLPLPVALMLAIIVPAIVGVLIEKLAIEPVKGAETVTLIIITIGASLVIRGLVAVFLGKNTHSLPPFSGDAPIEILGATLLPQSLWVLGVTALVVVALWYFFNRTLQGKAMLATSVNRLAAELVGINTGWVLFMSFAMSAALGALGGILLTPITMTSYDVGIMLGLKGFVAAVLGGLGNGLGAVVGGLLVGILEAMGAGYISSAYKDAIPFVLILFILFFMPRGLFGGKSTDRV
ncbi:branched-chain amino acid ABC transporter permease [Dechloromonas agitata]|jgi:branched-chain amino acid transport system permease protein|uniref:Branched-chain amino acid ABC transporter permease n=1 Tax=Dechloromonas agitata TaxID=73030 RepID=A0A930BS17_9RHOO|nr:branched-chain amino acid ABC transporter permease [Dechloromonas agitata]MBF1165064.1 branched-chain amino acid ABC transporter permease [Dechloromonas agitata]MBP8194292.1 branched-chain amino acid ABC transporter permease [Azonexus sp.]MBV2192618.1 branched-chain amino acid ABC transporter permease [Azonexus sp.]MDE1547010.1 branched-chain amino acid ABC transporter permease [Dechloromonas agitata]